MRVEGQDFAALLARRWEERVEEMVERMFGARGRKVKGCARRESRRAGGVREVDGERGYAARYLMAEWQTERRREWLSESNWSLRTRALRSGRSLDEMKSGEVQDDDGDEVELLGRALSVG